MVPQDTIDLSREAITMAAIVGGPILAAGLLIGLLLGVFQAMTQIQDQTVSAVPKIVGMALVALLTLPWMSERMVDFTRSTISRPLVGGQRDPVRQTRNQFSFHSTEQKKTSPPVRFAAAVGRGTPGPTSTAPSDVAPLMPTLRFNDSSMPRVKLPVQKQPAGSGSPFKLPTFGRKVQADVRQNIGG